jgi:hypothetical protein
MHSLSRQIEGVKAKAIREKLADLQLPQAGEARGAAGSDQEGPRPEAHTQRKAKAQEKGQSPAPPHAINRTQDRHHDELGRFYTESQKKRLDLGDVTEGQYGQDERRLRGEIAELDETLKNSSKARLWLLKKSGQIPKNAEQHLENLRRGLDNIEWRKGEMRQALEREIGERSQNLKARQQQERERLQPEPPKPEPANQNSPAPVREFEQADQEQAPEDEARIAYLERLRARRQRGPSRERE